MVIITEREIIPLLICLGILVFIWFNRLQLKRVPSSRVLLWGFYLLCAVKVFGILEEFFYEDFINFLQHLSSAGTIIFLTIWTFKICKKRGGGK